MTPLPRSTYRRKLDGAWHTVETDGSANEPDWDLADQPAVPDAPLAAPPKRRTRRRLPAPEKRDDR